MGRVFADTDQAIEDILIARLRQTAAELGVADLLEQALREQDAP